jgi:hypothetical protein
LRVRVAWPVPHETLHADQRVQLDNTQSIGHGDSAHLRYSPRKGHSTPPKSSLLTTSRVRVWKPVPQVLEQVLHSPNEVTSQWIGHGPLLHVCDWLRSPQSLPPCSAETVTWRDRVSVPWPQLSEHSLHSLHGVASQSIGHAACLQATVSSRSSHALPPYAASISTLRWRFFWPPPQLTVHAPQEPQVLTTQSVGHAWVLQVR